MDRIAESPCSMSTSCQIKDISYGRTMIEVIAPQNPLIWCPRSRNPAKSASNGLFVSSLTNCGKYFNIGFDPPNAITIRPWARGVPPPSPIPTSHPHPPHPFPTHTHPTPSPPHPTPTHTSTFSLFRDFVRYHIKLPFIINFTATYNRIIVTLFINFRKPQYELPSSQNPIIWLLSDISSGDDLVSSSSKPMLTQSLGHKEVIFRFHHQNGCGWRQLNSLPLWHLRTLFPIFDYVNVLVQWIIATINWISQAIETFTYKIIEKYKAYYK